jgi:myo-inositol-1(or 4)-monophosphatase
MALTETEREALRIFVAQLQVTVLEAGTMAMTAFRPGERTTAEIRWKEGSSPVTSMDVAVDRFLATEIARMAMPNEAFARLAYHSEENPETWQGDDTALHIVVDPIDGTRGFMNGRLDWCISLGLVWQGEAVAGLIHAPARGDLFMASAGHGAFWNGERQRLNRHGATSGFIASGPRGLIEEMARAAGLAPVLAPDIHALAHRLVRPITGEFGFAFARSGGHDWDLAAADAILAEAGGAILDLAGSPPRYALDGSVHPALVAGEAIGLRALIARSHLTDGPQAAKRPA